jgi:peroxiredoxin
MRAAPPQATPPLIDPAPQPIRSPRLRRSALAVGMLAAAGIAVLAGTSARTAETDASRRAALPRFEGPLAGGGRGGSDQLLGKRALVLVFAPSNPDLERASKLIASVAAEARAANVALLGVAAGVDPAQAQRVARLHDFDFPIVADPKLDIARKLRLEPGASRLLVVDAQGLLIGGFALDAPEDVDPLYEAELRRVLHLRKPGELEPELGVEPAAPAFEVVDLSGSRLASPALQGKVGVLMFFQPTCPHCHEMLKFFRKFLAENRNPDLVFAPISASEQKYVVEQMVEDLELPFPVYLDPQHRAAHAFDHRLAVPDMLVIDRTGHITARHTGAEPRLQALLTMEIRSALGVANPILLEKTGYSGADFCQACHREQHATWALTTHAFAFETLVEHNVDQDPECLPCHTVGWNEPGGYSLERPAPFLEGVQCENCHGRGGPHQSPRFATEVGYEKACLRCHTEENSLNFSFAERLPLISHAANRGSEGLSLQQRMALVRQRDKRQRALFAPADYVGSDACRGCHAAEFEQWQKTAHASAFERLRAEHKDADPHCQKCHTTGAGENTGWPSGGAALAGVGCESCHGPGSRHVAAGAQPKGTILRLHDKCDSCVILQICGSCHDDANDPGFEFELEQKLAVVRHGPASAMSGAK